MTTTPEGQPRLSARQKAFIEAYLGVARLNATAAARIAGYRDPEQAGYENKRKQEVRARIEERLQEEALSKGEVLAELAAVARMNWREAVQVRLDERDEVVDARMELRDKVRSLELLGKAYGLFTERVQVESTVDVRHLAERAAQDAGLDPDEVIAEAERFLQEATG